ncbi:MAG: hypothetical protein M1816_004646, partial [Peltula sp. TS41687]
MSPTRTDRKGALNFISFPQPSENPSESSSAVDESTGHDHVPENLLYHPENQPPANDLETPKDLQQFTDDLGEKDIFAKLIKTRVRYDVEVVTKLVVYAGIGLLSVEINPIIFELVGLGMGTRSP